MDKELLRIVIIATGFLVILGMIVWSYLKNRNTQNDWNEIEDEKVIGASGAVSNALKLHTEHDDFDIVPVPVGSAKCALDDNDNASDWESELNDDGDFDDEIRPDERNVLPEILQFGVVARDDEGFNGVDLVLVFGMVDLEYGDLKVYERINKNGNVDYGVACMVEPGTFPDGEYLASFHCPGIVFYLQHQNFEDAQAVFDDFVETIKTVAKELDGVIWDHQRQPLTEETIQLIRNSL
jgi:cell division protein ZipA